MHTMASFLIHDCKYDFGNLFTGEPFSDSILIGRNMYSEAPSGGVLENPAYSLPRDLQVAPGTQPVTATTGGGDSQHKQ